MSTRCPALLLALLAGACCTPSPGPPDFSTPEATLRTFQQAFHREDVSAEYECFSLPFKANNGNFGLDDYYEFRRRFVEEHPVAAFLFSRNDLSNNITARSPLQGRELAWLKLEVAGEEVTIDFILETVYRLEYGAGARPEEDFLADPEEAVRARDGRLEITLPLSPRTCEHLPELRRVLVEKRWKFLDFSFLRAMMSPSN